MTSNQFRPDLQAIRGLAVIAVILFHLEFDLFSSGFLGVDVFFVISGFLITPMIFNIFTQDLNSKNFVRRIRMFYRKRFYRLFPALALTVFFSIVLVFLFGSPLDHGGFARQGIATLLMVGNLGALRYAGDYFSPNPNPLIHTWSLAVEEQIYLLLPLIFFTLFNKLISYKRKVLIFLYAGTFISLMLFILAEIANPAITFFRIHSIEEYSFYSALTRFWQFSVGGILGISSLDRKVSQKKSRFYRLCNVLFSSLLIILLISDFEISNTLKSLFVTFVSCVVIKRRTLDTGPIMITKIFSWIGDRSYSLYLVHMPIMYVGLHSPLFSSDSIETQVITKFITLLLTFFAGSILYEGVEQRFRLKDSNLMARRSVGTSFKVWIYTGFAIILLLAIMDFSARGKYFGLDRNSAAPTYSASLKNNCNQLGVCEYFHQYGSKVVMLIGDSHAAHIETAMIQASKQMNWNLAVWTDDGCKVALRESSRNKVSRDCAVANRNKLKWVQENKPELVLIAQYISSDSNLEDVKEALLVFKENTKDLALVSNVPIFPDKKRYMVRFPVLFEPYNPPKSFLLGDMYLKDRVINATLGSWAKQSGIEVLDFTNFICDNRACHRFKNGEWLYRDNNHLSVPGAALTIPMIAELLDRHSELSRKSSLSSSLQD